MTTRFDNSGVQVNYSMINPPDVVDYNCAIQESRRFPYINVQECRDALLKAYNKHVRGQENKSAKR